MVKDPISNGAIGIQGDRIIYVGITPDHDNLRTYDEVIDCKGKAILPGLVNTHNHVAMSLLRGYADDLPLKTW
jgi:5-methylthioadenosine/S-adenosylhomocysteine deaminase